MYLQQVYAKFLPFNLKTYQYRVSTNCSRLAKESCGVNNHVLQRILCLGPELGKIPFLMTDQNTKVKKYERMGSLS
jgi:hypothetical protein